MEYRIGHGHVSGRAAAVINFHRLQRLLNAIGKRWLILVLAFYFDDVTAEDLAVCGMVGQDLFRAFWIFRASLWHQRRRWIGPKNVITLA